MLAFMFGLLALSHAFAYDLVETSWSEFKTFKTRDSFTVFYIEFPQGTDPETYQYRVYGANSSFYFKTGLLESSEISDFETNFKASAQNVGSEPEAIGKARVPFSKTGSLTSSSTTSLQTVLSYTVPAKQVFHLEQWMVGRVSTGNAELTIAQLQVNGTPVDGQSDAAQAGFTTANRVYSHPLPIAVAGDVITVKVTPNVSSSTVFGARILGELR